MATQPDIDLHSEDDAFRADVQQFLANHFPDELKGKGNLLSAVEGPTDESEAERKWREAMVSEGALPLDALEEQVESYIARAKR